MDLPGEFYLQTIDRVFQQRLMARGLYRYRGRQVRPEAMRDIALMTVEGEKDDITGVGQTEAAHRLATGLPSERRRHLLVEAVGHYGIFNGSRWRSLIQPQVRDFIRANSRPKQLSERCPLSATAARGQLAQTAGRAQSGSRARLADLA